MLLRVVLSCTVRSTVYDVQCMNYTVCCTVYDLQCTTYSVHSLCTVYNVEYISNYCLLADTIMNIEVNKTT